MATTTKWGYRTDAIFEQSHIKNRGPDESRTHRLQLSRVTSLLFGGCVLHLRGDLTPQPIRDDDQNVFLWNGEVFGGLDMREDENDTEALFRRLTNSVGDDDMLKTLSGLHGPWAFIYWQAHEKKLWFGRDVFGRRSLLWHQPENSDDVFVLSSVQIKPHIFHEVPSIGIYSLDFSQTLDTQCQPKLKIFPWRDVTWPGTMDKVVDENLQNKIYPSRTELKIHLSMDRDLPSWMPVLNKELPPLDYELPRLPTASSQHGEDLFSDYLLSVIENEVMRKSMEQLKDILLKAVATRVHNLPRKTKTKSCLNLPGALLDSSLTDGTPDGHGCPEICRSHGNGLDENAPSEDGGNKAAANVAVLFSGGIDSTVIAALADRCVPRGESIDLINVAFEQQTKPPPPHHKRKGKVKSNKTECSDETEIAVNSFNVPDRVTGYSALSELNPRRQWNFIEVNVTLPELLECRKKYVQELIYPLTSVLDDSIGCAVWFAARGHGILGNGPHKGQLYRSKAKVVLCGMGADEQLAGYSRHRSRFRDNGWQGVIEEVDMEMKRISARNLGRDDRTIADHGREARFPFLDENVVAFLASLPLHVKADLSLPRGVGEKLLLRLLATQLGLRCTAVLPKRAIQFGSRIAKLENRGEKATDVCTRLTPSSS